ncbi:hypothetical protein EDD18DRAFT_1098851 [Armillaria luteobubalina]|uniref:Uncharacterized protein n=1 Tax=Armillaria luteobubalina TaxID=153913 RepID=A0AA39QND6_9AGAR|nr:hypothetical protein EDD18DRAFT_1098851 [Armillaria luteobubalina]
MLPADISLKIANLLWRDDLLNLSLTALYDTVVLTSSRTCRKTLRMLQQRPEICRYIHKLVMRLMNPISPFPDSIELIGKGPFAMSSLVNGLFRGMLVRMDHYTTTCRKGLKLEDPHCKVIETPTVVGTSWINEQRALHRMEVMVRWTNKIKFLFIGGTRWK